MCTITSDLSHVALGKIAVHAISTEDQRADLWTKPLNRNFSRNSPKLAFGWDIKAANKLAREELRKVKAN